MVSSAEKALKEKISKVGYINAEHTAKDVMSVLSSYRGLFHSVESYAFTNGIKRDLLHLTGTIPVPYKGQFYNIPISIWLMDTHPNNAPLCYVKPTADMRIKVSKTVDHNGKVYLPVLHFWDPRKSDLMSLIQSMIATFSQEPPVYSRPKDGSLPQPSQQTQQPQQSQHTSYTPYPTQPYMPVPGGSANPPYPPASSSYQHNATPYPPSQQYPTFPTAASNFHGSSGFPYPSGGSGTPYPAYPSYPGATTSPSSGTQGTDSNTGTITQQHLRLSLLSAVEDKMRRSFREQIGRVRDELDLVRQSQTELEKGKNRLDDILSRLAKEQEELDKNITMLKDKEQELGKAIERLTDQDPIDVDEAVTTTAPLYKQILNTYAEEAATEDTIYYMGEALRRGVIDLEVFLKQVRSLSRRQFMLRALMQKCRLKAGLK